MKTTTRKVRIPTLAPIDSLATLARDFVTLYETLVEAYDESDPLGLDEDAITAVERRYDQVDDQIREAMCERGLPVVIVDGWLLINTSMDGPYIPDRPHHIHPFDMGGND
jgi:hypothetical protein